MSNNPLNKDEFYLENFLKSDLYKDLEKIPKPNNFKFGNKQRKMATSVGKNKKN